MKDSLQLHIARERPPNSSLFYSTDYIFLTLDTLHSDYSTKNSHSIHLFKETKTGKKEGKKKNLSQTSSNGLVIHEPLNTLQVLEDCFTFRPRFDNSKGSPLYSLRGNFELISRPHAFGYAVQAKRCVSDQQSCEFHLGQIQPLS